MKAMPMFEFNVKVLKPMDGDPEYKRLKPYYELCSGVKSRREKSIKTLRDRKDRYWGTVFTLQSQYHTPSGIERCANCGKYFGDYQQYFDFGNDQLLCRPCCDALRDLTPMLIHHIPGFVERDDIPAYLWKDLATFLKDHPNTPGYHYAYSEDDIMEIKDDHSEWWVLWHIKHPRILKEVMDGMQKFVAHPGSDGHI